MKKHGYVKNTDITIIEKLFIVMAGCERQEVERASKSPISRTSSSLQLQSLMRPAELRALIYAIRNVHDQNVMRDKVITPKPLIHQHTKMMVLDN